VGKYEKVEFLIHADTRYRNPFDPKEVDLSVVLDTPDGKQLSLPAFTASSMSGGRCLAGADRPPDVSAGRARLEGSLRPRAVGTYRAAVRLKDRGHKRLADTPVRVYTVRPQGFLCISRKDPRFFELSEGEPLFAIGQNLAFIGEGQYVNLAKAEEIFATLSRNGANYLRIWTCCEDWAMAVEAARAPGAGPGTGNRRSSRPPTPKAHSRPKNA